MLKKIKKSGQKIAKRLSRLSVKAGVESKEHIRENVIERFSHIKDIKLLILEWSLSILVLIFLAITQAFWYSESYAVSTFTNGGTYTEATLGKVNSLNPLFASTSSEKVLSKLMFGTLTAVDYSGHTGLGLADSITADDAGLVWTIHLREGVRWSDGHEMTNEDVMFTVKLLQSPYLNTSYSSNLSGVKVEEQEDGTISFTLSTAYANFNSALDFPILPAHVLKDVQPSALLEHSFSTKPITSGAFAFRAMQAVGNNGEKIVYLTPNKSYYRGAPMLESFTVHAYTTKEDIIAAVNTGTITGTAELLPTDSERITNGAILERQTALNSGAFLFFNMNSPVMSNKAIRKALQAGIDKRSLRAPLEEETALDYPLLDNQIKIDDLPALPEYDPENAREIIARSESEKRVTLVAIDSGYLPALAENLKYQLENLGLTVDVQIYPATQEFLINIIRPRNYDILLYEIELGSDPDIFAYYHSSQVAETGLNLSNYSNTLASDAILAARNTMDEALRATKYKMFIENWIEDAPAIAIYQVNMSYYGNKNVRNYSDGTKIVTPIDRFSNVYLWATEKITKNRTP